MSEHIKRFKRATMPEIDWKARHGVDLNNGERLAHQDQWFESFATMVAADCIAMIRLKMPRNGVNSVENVQSKKHIADIAQRYGVSLPLDQSVYENIIAGADTMSGNGGYEVANLDSPEFLAARSKYSDIISDGGMDPRNKKDAGS